MTDYDIVQVEDDPNTVKFVGKSSQREGLTYISFSALDELEAAVEDTSGRFWVVDGRFPKTRGDVIENNSARAVELIRSHYPDARIALYSAGMFASSDAQKLGIECFDKGAYTADDLVIHIKTMLR